MVPVQRLTATKLKVMVTMDSVTEYTQYKLVLLISCTVKIQGTLVKDPASTDWVDIASVVTSDGSTAITNSYLNNFTGNFVWIRIAVSDFTAGTINNIFMAH